MQKECEEGEECMHYIDIYLYISVDISDYTFSIVDKVYIVLRYV